MHQQPGHHLHRFTGSPPVYRLIFRVLYASNTYSPILRGARLLPLSGSLFNYLYTAVSWWDASPLWDEHTAQCVCTVKKVRSAAAPRLGCINKTAWTGDTMETWVWNLSIVLSWSLLGPPRRKNMCSIFSSPFFCHILLYVCSLHASGSSSNISWSFSLEWQLYRAPVADVTQCWHFNSPNLRKNIGNSGRRWSLACSKRTRRARGAFYRTSKDPGRREK